MSTLTFLRPELRTERESKVVMHVVRCELGLLSVIHRLFFKEVTEEMCRKVLQNLCDEGYLSKHKLWDCKKLYRLGPKSVSRWHFPRKRIHHPGYRLPYVLGCYAYTSMDEVIRKRLLTKELLKHVPGFPKQKIGSWAYLYRKGTLSTIRVESQCNPKRVIKKLAEQHYAYRELTAIRELDDNGRFRFVVVVSSEYQEAVLHDANSDYARLPLDTAHYPELIRFS